MFKGFSIKLFSGATIKFKYYENEAPVTVKAFNDLLPFKKLFFHARFSGSEFWIDDLQSLDIIQENASVFTLPGEVVLGPLHPKRNKTSNCLGIYYGEGKGLDAANIFAKVIDEDFQKLQQLGNEIWRNGAQELLIQKIV